MGSRRTGSRRHRLRGHPRRGGHPRPAGSRDAEPEVVAQLPADWFRTTGLAVDGERAYLTGATYTGDDFPESVLAVDLATGTAGTPVVVCADGSTAGPQLRGDTLLVSGTCNDEALLQEHVYLLRAA